MAPGMNFPGSAGTLFFTEFFAPMDSGQKTFTIFEIEILGEIFWKV
jgi:hypothetical protein